MEASRSLSSPDEGPPKTSSFAKDGDPNYKVKTLVILRSTNRDVPYYKTPFFLLTARWRADSQREIVRRGLPGRRALRRRFLPPFRGFCPRVLGGSPLLPLEGGILDPPSFKSLLRRGSSFPAFPFAFLWRRNLKHPDQHGIRRGLWEGGRTPY